MASVEGAPRLIGYLCEASFRPDRLVDSLVWVSDYVGARWATLVLVDNESCAVTSALGVGGAEDRLDAYRDHYVTLDPRWRFILAQPQRQLVQRNLSAFGGESPAFCRWFRQFGEAGEFAGASFPVSDHLTAVLFVTFNLDRDMGACNLKAIQRLESLLPCLEEAMPAVIRTACSEDIANAATEILDRFTLAIIVFDNMSRVLHANPAANKLFGEGDLIVRNGRVISTLKAYQSPLDNFINELGNQDSNRVASSFVLPRRSGKRPYMLRGSSLLLPHDFGAANHHSSVLMIADSDNTGLPTRHDLKMLFKLTAREAELALFLAEGYSLAETAEQMQIKQKTARLHLDSVFRKTNTHRQTQLVRLLLACSAPLC